MSADPRSLNRMAGNLLLSLTTFAIFVIGWEVAVARFTAAVRGEGEPLASADDGIASLAVATAALESARTGRPVAPRVV